MPAAVTTVNTVSAAVAGSVAIAAERVVSAFDAVEGDAVTTALRRW